MEVSALTHAGSMPGLRGPTALLRLQSDERLIALTRRGQPAAFETLCARYSSRLQAFCRHMLGSREDAEDVLQEVFAAAFNAVLADEREINVRPWLYRIARNRSLNHLRRAAAIGVDTMDTHFAENGISTSDKVLRRESFRELIADVHELPETQRTALLLREIDALSYDQIAQAMETTIPSVKSLLVRARISLAEAAEARKLSCGEVRLELGEVAEGLVKLSTPARRHVRSCERCAFFKKQLKVNNRALAAVMPVGPLLLFKKLLIAKLGSTASAGGAHVAGGAGATMGAGATVGAGAAAGGGAGLAGGLMTAGAGAIATKAVAGLAAAAIVTAGTVAAEHSGAHHPHANRAATYASVPSARYAAAPVVVGEQAQPVTAGRVALRRHAAAAARARARRLAAAKALSSTPAPSVAAALPALTPATGTQPGLPVATPVEPPSAVQVTEVTTEATQLPTGATTPPTAAPATPTATTPTSETPPVAAPPTETSTATGPPPPPPATTTPTTPSSPSTTPVALPSAEPVAVPDPGAGAPVARRSPRRVLAGGTEAPAHHSSDGGWGRRWAIRR